MSEKRIPSKTQRLREDVLKLVEAAFSRNGEQARAFAADLALALDDAVLNNRLNKVILGVPHPEGPLNLDSRIPLLETVPPQADPPKIHLSGTAEQALQRFVTCALQNAAMEAAGIPPVRTAILCGPTGVGKTLAARTIAHRLERPLGILRVAALVESHLGATGGNLARVFQYAREHPMVLFLDEIDALGRQRGDAANDVGEMWRVVVSLLQLLDAHDGIVLAATNQTDALDPALLRRFEYRLEVGLPASAARAQMVRQWLGAFCPEDASPFVETTSRWSGADIETVCRHAARSAFLARRATVTASDWDEAVRFIGKTPRNRKRGGVMPSGHQPLSLFPVEADAAR